LRGSRAPLIAAPIVLGLTLTPWVVNTLGPPTGSTFVGTFYYVDDFYNYLSFARQAEDGAFVFTNQALLSEHRPALVNLEWWAVGRLSRLLGGGHLVGAYRLLGVLAALGFLFGADLWLKRLGLGEAHRLPALLLLSLGGGLGGILFAFFGRAFRDCLDLFTGLFPFVGFLTNPHFTVGTTLLLLGLLAFEAARTQGQHAIAILLANALALIRPYDFVFLVLIRTTVVLVLDEPRRWLEGLLPLAFGLPAVAYLYWLFYVNPAFAFYSSTPYVFPALSDFVWALGPAVLLALLGSFRATEGDEARRAKAHLITWCGLALLVVLVRPTGFSLQFLVGLGFPLFALAALGLSRGPARVTFLTAAAFSVAALTAIGFVSRPRSLWLTGRATMDLVTALRPACREGDIVFAPPEVGIYAYGLTRCRAVVSHQISPDHRQRLARLQRFGAAPPPERARILDALRVTFLVLPGDGGEAPTAWLGAEPAFRREAVFGDPVRLSLYRRRP
jgi:hypothetical protein